MAYVPEHLKLFIPGPVECTPETLKAMGSPMVGHRSQDFVNLYNEIQPKLQKVLLTSGRIYLGSCSATGISAWNRLHFNAAFPRRDT